MLTSKQRTFSVRFVKNCIFMLRYFLLEIQTFSRSSISQTNALIMIYYSLYCDCFQILKFPSGYGECQSSDFLSHFIRSYSCSNLIGILYIENNHQTFYCAKEQTISLTTNLTSHFYVIVYIYYVQYTTNFVEQKMLLVKPVCMQRHVQLRLLQLQETYDFILFEKGSGHLFVNYHLETSLWPNEISKICQDHHLKKSSETNPGLCCLHW